MLTKDGDNTKENVQDRPEQTGTMLYTQTTQAHTSVVTYFLDSASFKSFFDVSQAEVKTPALVIKSPSCEIKPSTKASLA